MHETLVNAAITSETAKQFYIVYGMIQIKDEPEAAPAGAAFLRFRLYGGIINIFFKKK